MEKRAHKRTPLQINAKCFFPDHSYQACHRCILMDVSPMGAGLLIESPVPLTDSMKVAIEFPLQCKNMRADIELKWSRSLGTTGVYNWAAGGLWSQIDENEKIQMLNQIFDSMAFEQIWEDQQNTI